jgi:hypothetical protein
MDRCGFSEFSYGYCVTEDLVVGKGLPITAAPVFPSLKEEGKTGVGYDVLLDRPGAPLFLQFKLVEHMERGNAKETKKGHFSPPFYRMHLRPSRISDQHQSLISLEQAGNEVYYVAPTFFKRDELNSAYADRQVWNRSFRTKPSAIGPLPNDKSHHVSFDPLTGNWRVYSEDPSRGGRASTTTEITEELQRRIKERGERNLREQIPELDRNLIEIVEHRNRERNLRERVSVAELGPDIDPLTRVSYLARQFFDCQMLFVVARP